jgi:hypothetical protein
MFTMLMFNKWPHVVTAVTTLLGLSLAYSAVGLEAEDGLAEKVKKCSSTAEDLARLECFDTIALGVVKKYSMTKTGQQGLPENLGGVEFDDNPVEKEVSRGFVTSCKKSLDRKWFFNFENGQVWKQVNADNRRYNYKGCNFPVTVRKDGFGYVMQIEDQDREIRIKRHK